MASYGSKLPPPTKPDWFDPWWQSKAQEFSKLQERLKRLDDDRATLETAVRRLSRYLDEKGAPASLWGAKRGR